MEKDSGKLGKKLLNRKVEKDVGQKPQVDKGEKRQETPTEKSRLFWLLPDVVVPFIIGMIVMVLISKQPDAAPLKKEQTDKEEVDSSVIPETKFRSTSREKLSGKSVIDMLKDKGLYDSNWNNSASGFTNDYKSQNDGKVVFDHASGLVWQQSGSSEDISYVEAENYIAQLNSDQFAGYSDWRLPTLEEAMSLMKPTAKSGGLHIDPVFDNTQRWIWTSDMNNVSLAWLANFIIGSCYTYVNDYFDFTSGGYVRAVR